MPGSTAPRVVPCGFASTGRLGEREAGRYRPGDPQGSVLRREPRLRPFHYLIGLKVLKSVFGPTGQSDTLDPEPDRQIESQLSRRVPLRLHLEDAQFVRESIQGGFWSSLEIWPRNSVTLSPTQNLEPSCGGTDRTIADVLRDTEGVEGQVLYGMG